MSPRRDTAPIESGDVLRAIRKRLDLTQQDLAVKLGYSRTTVTNAERGRDISPAFIASFADAFPAFREELSTVHPTSAQREPRADEAVGPEALTDLFFRRSTKTTDLDGLWFALWETTVDGEVLLNSEALQLKMKRDGSLVIHNEMISEENEKGGFLWVAQARVYDNQYVLGTYIAREPNVRSKGCLYIVIHQSGRFLVGQWIGCNYDGDWARGLVVMARTKDRLAELMDKQRKTVPTMPYN